MSEPRSPMNASTNPQRGESSDILAEIAPYGAHLGDVNNPTRKTYAALNGTYIYFNKALFNGQLPHCLITLQRKARARGYYAHERFIADDGSGVCDEIALNPQHWRQDNLKQNLSTLVHEMVHKWQFCFGTPPKGVYHDRQFCEKMYEVG